MINSPANKVEPNLKVLRLTDYESYQLPFRTQAVADIFVDDLRDDNDDSLNLVPRITTFAQLKETFKLDVDFSLGGDSALPGELYWAVIGFYLRTGIAAFIPKVLAENGQPVPPPGALVFAHWPGAPTLPDTPNPYYHGNAVAGFTNSEGDVGFGYSGGAVVGGDGGVYDIWVSADPPTGTRFYSDAAIRLGWWGGTDHLTPNPIFQAVRKSGTVPPPTGDSRLVVYDQQGNYVGYTPLVTGQGNGGRIALVTDGQELAHTKLE
jgi:hypothetical protein